MKKLALMGLVAALSISMIGCSAKVGDKETPNPEPTEQEIQLTEIEDAEDQEEAQIMNLVTSFGEKIKNVSLLSPKDLLQESMDENYSEYVSQDLLEKWLENPEEAPGRLVSSPWPEMIDITDVEKVSDGIYKVEGKIVEKTSAELLEESKPITFEVEKIDDKWIITSYASMD